MITAEVLSDRIEEISVDLFQQQQQLAPMWYLYARDGSMEVVVPQLMMEGNKSEIVELVKQRIQASDVVMVGFASEAWSGKPISQKQLEEGDFVPPSKQSDRQEVLMIVVEGPDSARNTEIPIDRQADGSPVLRMDARRVGVATGGMFMGLLNA